jgi:hypothetical protein
MPPAGISTTFLIVCGVVSIVITRIVCWPGGRFKLDQTVPRNSSGRLSSTAIDTCYAFALCATVTSMAPFYPAFSFACVAACCAVTAPRAASTAISPDSRCDLIKSPSKAMPLEPGRHYSGVQYATVSVAETNRIGAPAGITNSLSPHLTKSALPPSCGPQSNV